MNGLKDWAMEVNYNSSRKSRIQQEKEDVRDDAIDSHGLTIKKILKRLNDLEEIVQDQGNLLEEQTLIIESNNERIGVLERIVCEHNLILDDTKYALSQQTEIIKNNSEEFENLQCVVSVHEQNIRESNDKSIKLNEGIDQLQLTAFRTSINCGVRAVIMGVFGYMNPCLYDKRHYVNPEYFEKSMDIIGEKWDLKEFDAFINKIDNYLSKYEPYNGIFTNEDVIIRSVNILNSFSQNTRNQFIIEEKIIRSYTTLKTLYGKILQMDSIGNFVLCNRY